MSFLTVGGTVIPVAPGSGHWDWNDAVDRRRSFDNTYRASATGGAARDFRFTTPPVTLANASIYRAVLQNVAAQMCSGDVMEIPTMCCAELVNETPVKLNVGHRLVQEWALHEVQGKKLLLKYSPGDTITGESFSRSTTATYITSSGALATAAIDAKRDAHYVGGVRSLFLEGAHANRLLWSNDLTNAAWTKRGTCAAALTATGPSGVVNSATAITGLGAVGVNDVYQEPVGYGATTRYEPSYWIQKVTATGTVRIQSVSGTGQWNVNLSLLGAGWERITRSHAALTIASEFVSTAGGAGGVQFSCPSGAPVAINLYGIQTEVGTFSTSTISTGAAIVTRGSDFYSLPFTIPPQELTLYAKFVESGSLSIVGARVAEITNAADTGARLILFSTGSFYSTTHDSGGGSVGSTLAAAPVAGDVVELVTRLFGDGSVDTTQSINGAASTAGAQSAANALASAWSGQLVWLNSGGTATAAGYTAIQSFKIVAGARSLAEMRAA